MKNKFDNYLKTRGLFLFIIFSIINIINFLPIDNFLVDIFSHFKFQYFLFGFLFSVLFIYLITLSKKYIIPCIICILIIFFNFLEISPYIGQYKKVSEQKSIKLGLYNLLTSNKNYKGFLDSVEKETPDIIILQEVDDVWIEKIKSIKKQYPYSIEHPRLDNFGIALYSKIPLTDSNIEFWTDNEVPVVVTNLYTNSNHVKIYGIHTLPPTGKEYFAIRNQMLEKINLDTLQEPNSNLIFAGDFNTTIYSKAYKQYLKSTDLKDCQILAKNLKGTWNTKHLPFFRIPLEHILISPNIHLKSFKVGKDFGSDHLPMYVELYF